MGLRDFNLFLSFIFEVISFMKFKRTKCLPVTLLNVVRYLIISLRCPVLKPYGECASASFKKTIFPEMVTKVVNQILLNLNKKDPAVLPKNIVYGLAGG